MNTAEYHRLQQASLASPGVMLWMVLGIMLLVPLPPIGIVMMTVALVRLHRRKAAYRLDQANRAMATWQCQQEQYEQALILAMKSL